MGRCIGIDLHRNRFSVCVLDEEGDIEVESEYETSRRGVERFRETLMSMDTVVFEVSELAFGMHDALVSRVSRVIVADPAKTRERSSGEAKTDRLDARRLARLGQDKHIAEAWVPDPETRRLRELVRFHQQLTKITTKMSNIEYAKGASRSIGLSGPGGKGLWANDRERAELLREAGREVAESARKQKAKLDMMFADWAVKTPEALLVMRHAGVGPWVAAVVIGAAGDIRRFENAQGFSSYTGLVPRVYQSGEGCHHGRITKAGRKELRHALVQAAWSAVRSDPALKASFKRIARTRGEGKAIVAIARKIATRLWHLMTEGHCDGLMSDEAFALKIKRIIRDNRIHIPAHHEATTGAATSRPKTDKNKSGEKGRCTPARGLSLCRQRV